MTRKILERLLAIFLLACGCAWGQAQPPSAYPAQLITYQGAPFGVCDVYQVALNVFTGDFYSCNPTTRTWRLAVAGILSSNNTITGTNSATGPWTFSSIDGILYIDANKFANIAAAETACGANQCVVIIPANYAGTDCPATGANTKANIFHWDFRATATDGPGGQGGTVCTGNTMTFNGTETVGGVHSGFRNTWTFNNPTVSTTGGYHQCFYGGTTVPASQTLECLTGETDIIGSYASISNTTSFSGSEHNLIWVSTGGTANNAYAAIFGQKTLGGSTTNITNAYNIRTIAFSKAGTGTVTNAIGALFDNQTAGSTNNWAFESQGESRFDCSLATQQCIHLVANTLANRNTLRMTNTATSGGDWLMGDGSCSTNLVGQWETCNLNVGAASYIAIKNTGTSSATMSFAPTSPRNYAWPDAGGNVVLDTATQTLTSKTLTSPVMSNPTSQHYLGSGTAPTCSVTGAGTGATCDATTVSGAKDFSGVIAIHTGTSPSAAGTFTLIYNGSYATNGFCTFMLLNSSSSWNARATVIGTSIGGSSQQANWDNNAVSLTGSSQYEVVYVCGGS